MGRTPDPAAITDWIRSEHRDVVDATARAAAAVADDWATDRVQDRARVVGPLRARLVAAGLLDSYAALLESLRERYTDEDGMAVVPAPPYVVVTSRGPVLRLSVPSGRIVVRFDLFAVERGSPVTYRYRGVEGRATVRVEVA